MISVPADQAAALLEGAIAALEAGDSASGEALLREAARRFPGHPEIALHLASLLRVVESDETEGAVRHAAMLAAGDATLLMRSAELTFRIGDLRGAQLLLHEVAQVMPDEFEHAGELAYLTGRVAEQAGRDDLAAGLLEDAFELHPENLEYGLVLAEFHAAHDRFERARDVVAIALEQRPGDEWLLALQGALNDWKDA